MIRVILLGLLIKLQSIVSLTVYDPTILQHKVVPKFNYHINTEMLPWIIGHIKNLGIPFGPKLKFDCRINNIVNRANKILSFLLLLLLFLLNVPICFGCRRSSVLFEYDPIMISKIIILRNLLRIIM